MKTNSQLFCCFHVTALLFMSARPILGHFLPIFYGFSSKLPDIPKLSLKIVIFFLILNTSLHFWCKIPNGGQLSIFEQILADFHEYTLNMASYHVIEAINGYF